MAEGTAPARISVNNHQATKRLSLRDKSDPLRQPNPAFQALDFSPRGKRAKDRGRLN
jgi:hypothetical protein